MDPVLAARSLLAEIRDSGERRLLWLAGGEQWTLAAAEAVVADVRPHRTIRLGSRDEASDPNRRTAHLGGECDLLIVDGWAGLDLDALGAASGTLRGGGLMLLLSPPTAQWRRFQDPSSRRFLSFPHEIDAVGDRTIGRILRLLLSSPAVCLIEETLGQEASPQIDHPTRRAPSSPRGLDSDPISPTDPAKAAHVPAATEDQAKAIDEILKAASGPTIRPLVLTADRGRGKSAAMGIAAARLGANRGSTILLTAPRRHAAEAVLRHAGPWAPRFIAPDALLVESPAADLLLVDEAAAIPAPLLEAMLSRWPRIVFATTVHGYEGSGRGFEVRFRRVLDRRAPGWQLLRLRQPIRWAMNDPLERLIVQLLLLDAEPAPDEAVAAVDRLSSAGALRAEDLDRDRLGADEALLRQVFGLLVLAHYQTRPSDLRQMLDAPDIAVHALRSGPHVLAVAVTGREGRLPEALHAAIREGRRRPRGHLLPQTLSAHADLCNAPALGYRRVLRIAVHPSARRRGLGKRLMEALTASARADGADLIGASFGATSELLRFWRACGLVPVHLGHRRNAASGAQAVVVLRGLTPEGQRFADDARSRFLARRARRREQEISRSDAKAQR